MTEEQIVEMLQLQNDLMKEFYVPQIIELEAENKKLRLKLVDRVLRT